jgi:uncharacterized protein (TIGR02118 family)
VSYQVTVLYHRPDDPAAFDQYYDEVHIPIAKKIPGLQGYTVTRPVPDESGQPAYHLVAALTFESQESMAGALASEEARAAVADIPNFATGGVTMLSGPVQTVS